MRTSAQKYSISKKKMLEICVKKSGDSGIKKGTQSIENILSPTCTRTELTLPYSQIQINQSLLETSQIGPQPPRHQKQLSSVPHTKHSTPEKKFIKEFWRVILKQNEKIDNLIEENHNLKSSQKKLNQEVFMIKAKLNKINDNENSFRAKTPVESISEFIRSKAKDVNNSKNLLTELKNANTEYMITNKDNVRKERSEGKLTKLYRSSKKTSIDHFDTFMRPPAVEQSNSKINGTVILLILFLLL